MAKQERRRSWGLNVTGNAEQYFVISQFMILMTTMVYLLYLIFGTIHQELSRVQNWNAVSLPSALDQIILLLLIRITILFLVVFFANLLLGLFFLHRLTGPLVRIRWILNQVAEGNIPSSEVVLRKGDFPTDIAKALSHALRRIRQWYRLETQPTQPKAQNY